MVRFKKNFGFTLIVLLIVVAIIAILAAIAVPNFLEAQVRAKVSRVKADQRTITTGLESYYVDHNKYPPEGDLSIPGGNYQTAWIDFFALLTTPVAYLSGNANMANDPFLVNTTATNISMNQWVYNHRRMTYANYMQYGKMHNRTNYPGANEPIRFNAWCLQSWGPDHNNDGLTDRCYNAVNTAYALWTIQGASNGTYDPTNGTVSAGDVGKFGGEVPPIVGVITNTK